MKNDLHQLIDIFESKIPANKLLGLKIDSLSVGKVSVHVPFKEAFIGDYRQGYWHGGILATIADAAAGLAGFTTLTSPDDRINTIDMRIDFLTPAVRTDIFAEVTLIKVGKRIINADVSLYQTDKQKPVAVARCAFSVLKHKT